MILRIEIEKQQFPTDRVEELEELLGEEVDKKKARRKNGDRLGEFWEYSETFDPEKVTGKIELVEAVPEITFIGGGSKVYVCDIEVLLARFPVISFKVRSAVQLIDNELNHLAGMYGKLEKALSSYNREAAHNERCNVHVANLGLLAITQTAYAVDCCTEKLQEYLNNGWRIIMCCPQPDQRRPDYVLGRCTSDEGNLKCIQI